MSSTGPTPPPGGSGGAGLARLARLPRWLTFALGILSGLLIATLVGIPTLRGDGLEPGELVIMSGADLSLGGQRNALIDVWNATHPDNQARIRTINEVADGQYTAMTRAGSEVDIFNLDVTWTAAFVHGKLIQSIDESLLPGRPDEIFLSNPLRTCRYGGKLWAVPFNTDAGLLFYRSDLVTETFSRTALDPARRPSWAEIESAARAALADRPPGSPLQAGYTAQLASYEALTVNALEALRAAGGSLDASGNGSVRVDVPRWTDALRQLRPETPGSIVLPDALDETHHEEPSREAFRAGRTVFMRNWPVAYRQLAGTDAAPLPSPQPGTQPLFEFDVTRLPGEAVLGGQNLAIAKDTKQRRAAHALIAFLTGTQSQQVLFERGGFAPTRAEVYDITKARYPQDTTDERTQREIRYIDLLRAEVEAARLRPESRHYVTFSKVLQRYVRETLVDGVELPKDLDRRLTSALREGVVPD